MAPSKKIQYKWHVHNVLLQNSQIAQRSTTLSLNTATVQDEGYTGVVPGPRLTHASIRYSFVLVIHFCTVSSDE